METIGIHEVDVSNRKFCISYPLDDELLCSSIARFGIVMPVVLLRAPLPVIVVGFKRFWAAEKLGIERIPCWFLDADEKQAVLTAINDNLSRPLNTVEKAHCVEMMRAAQFPTQAVLEIARIVGLPAKEKTIETASAVVALNEETKAFVARHGIPLAGIEQLLYFGREERDRILAMLDPLDVTVSSFREALQIMMLLKAKHGRIDLAPLEKMDNMIQLKQALKKSSHPVLSELEASYKRTLRSCALPPNIKIRLDPVFEKDWIEVSIRVRDNDEAGRAITKLESLYAEGLFGSLLELTQGLPNRN